MSFKLPSSYLTLGSLLWVVAVGIAGCGDGLMSDSSSSSSPDYRWTPEPSLGAYGPFDKFTILGSIVTAFQIKVDGQTYKDSEDFYTAELGRLNDKVFAAGYTGWEVRFEAVLGFSDLARGMTVYVSPKGNKGPSGQADVSVDGNFRVTLPASEAARDERYSIRAVKRVNVVLSRGGELRKFCYNFSAVEDAVSIANSPQIRMDTFETRLTSYACESQPGEASIAGPSISPAAQPAVAAPPSARIALNESAESVVEKFGDPTRISKAPYTSMFGLRLYDLQWTYERLPKTPLGVMCVLYFRNQVLTAFERCPAARIDFSEGSSTAGSTPTARIVYRDSPQTVLSKWGIPTLVSLSVDGTQLTWEYTHSTLSTSACTLKFRLGELIEYSGGCRLGFVAHWTF